MYASLYDRSAVGAERGAGSDDGDKHARDDGLPVRQRDRAAGGVRRQSACAKLTLKVPPNVRVPAPKTSECVRRSVQSVKVRAPIHVGGERMARRGQGAGGG